MSQKSKGSNAERELLHKFWGVDWACIRVAGSGSMLHPAPDLLAGNGFRRIAVECKTTIDNSKYFTQKEIEELRDFARLFGAEAWVGIRFMRKEWVFLNLEDLKVTSKSFVADSDICDRKGLSFDELIS